LDLHISACVLTFLCYQR